MFSLLPQTAMAQVDPVDQLCSVIESNQADSNRQMRALYCRLAALNFGAREIASRGQNGVSAPQARINDMNQACQNVSSTLLLNPGSVRYPSSPNTLEIFPGVYITYGQLDAQNDYGALRRASYICGYVWNGNNSESIGIQLMEN